MLFTLDEGIPLTTAAACYPYPITFFTGWQPKMCIELCWLSEKAVDRDRRL